MQRRIALVGLVVVSLLVVTGSGSFSAMSTDRGLEVSVVNDENAYLAIQNEEALNCGNPPGNAILHNQFDTTLDSITAEISVPDGGESSLRVKAKGTETAHELSSGESAEIVFEGNGGYGYDSGEGPILQVTPVNGTTPNSIEIGISRVTGAGLGVSLDERTFEVDCANEAGAS